MPRQARLDAPETLGRRKAVTEAGSQITCSLVEEHGLSLSEVARNVGVTTSAIFRILKRNGSKLM